MTLKPLALYRELQRTVRKNPHFKEFASTTSRNIRQIFETYRHVNDKDTIQSVLANGISDLAALKKIVDIEPDLLLRFFPGPRGFEKKSDVADLEREWLDDRFKDGEENGCLIKLKSD